MEVKQEGGCKDCVSTRRFEVVNTLSAREAIGRDDTPSKSEVGDKRGGAVEEIEARSSKAETEVEGMSSGRG